MPFLMIKMIFLFILMMKYILTDWCGNWIGMIGEYILTELYSFVIQIRVVLIIFMEQEIESSMGKDNAVSYALKKIQNLEKKIVSIKLFSQNRRTARKQMLAMQRKNQMKRYSDQQQQFLKAQQLQPTRYRKQSFNGLVIQVPCNNDLHYDSVNPYSPRSSTYYLSEILKNYKDTRSAAREHLTASLTILKALQNSKMPTKQQVYPKILTLERKPNCIGKKTIVFDLDETLIHCNESVHFDHDLKIQIKFPTGEVSYAGINIRPGAFELLQNLKDKFQVIIFTASHSCYANQILDHLDPTKQLIHHRLYREHCFISNEGYYIKDLRVLGRPLKDVLLVDNAAYSYAFQLDNGVPIIPYFKGKNDFQLKALENYLFSFLTKPQLRQSNGKLFKFNRYLQFNGQVERLVQQLYA